MGFFAGSIDSADAAPKNDFHVPPPASTKRNGVVAGTVTDPFTGKPVVGAVVAVTGQGTNFRTVTDADGAYRISGLVVGRYAKVVATGPGYLGGARAVTAIPRPDFDPGTDSTDFQMTRDWAALSGGARVTSAEGPDFSDFGCGPDQGFDTSLTTGWGSVSLDADQSPDNVFDPKSITVRLSQPVDITHFEVDPDATCGDDAELVGRGLQDRDVPGQRDVAHGLHGDLHVREQPITSMSSTRPRTARGSPTCGSPS